MAGTKTRNPELAGILKENERRNAVFKGAFDPITGHDSVGPRTYVHIPDFAIPDQWLPDEMLSVPLVRRITEAGSIDAFIKSDLRRQPSDEDRALVSEQLIRTRFVFDFPFWAASYVRIHNKDAGNDVLFRLRYPQRLLVSRFEEKRRAKQPIRLILLKARQWGGSTTTQMYMAWLQFFHKRGLNSLIIAQTSGISDEIKDMFDTMIKHYPARLLHPLGEAYDENEPKMVRVGKSGTSSRVPQRNCKIKIGSAESPDSCRGGAYSLIHLSEVGIWKKTEGKSPQDIVRSACSGVLYRPMTMIVMESTANGTGNFFHTEYCAAADPDIPSQYEPLFIAWYQIEQYSLPFESDEKRNEFAADLIRNRENDNARSAREESGRYLWWLWEKGASLEAIHWYVHERAGRNDHAVMASEYPSDDIEAFVHSGAKVFDRYKVEDLRKTCRPPRLVGEVVAKSDKGPDTLVDLHFSKDSRGCFSVWALPESDPETIVTDRYLAVVDIGGRSAKADFSVITVFDRINMIDGQPPAVVAQWRGHCDIDRLAWCALRIAAFYENALLVIESNTLETHDRERQIEGGDQSMYILNQIAPLYPQLYARRQSEDEIRQGIPRKYGFHTNTATKPMIISTLINVVRDKLYTERDTQCLDEYLTYELKQNGSYGAILGKHDDILMTRAIGLHICFNEMPVPTIVPRRRPRPKRTAGLSEATW